MVLSASLKAILLNEGSIGEQSSSAEINAAMQDIHRPIEHRPLLPKTDSGVAIGMTELQVRKLLGNPDSAFFSKKFKAKELVYRRTTPKSRDGVYGLYRNYYLFENGKLYYIELRYDQIGGA